MYSRGDSGDPVLGIDLDKRVLITACRIGMVGWLYTTYQTIRTEQSGGFEHQLGFPCRLMSFFTTLRPVSGLTDQDLEAFVKQDMIDEYGAERILLRYSQLLNDLRKEFSSASQLPSIEDLCRNLSKIVVYPGFRQYYASSGFLSALCDLL